MLKYSSHMKMKMIIYYVKGKHLVKILGKKLTKKFPTIRNIIGIITRSRWFSGPHDKSFAIFVPSQYISMVFFIIVGHCHFPLHCQIVLIHLFLLRSLHLLCMKCELRCHGHKQKWKQGQVTCSNSCHTAKYSFLRQ